MCLSMSWIGVGNILYRHTGDNMLSRNVWDSSTLICLVIMGAFPLFAVYTHALTITYNTLLLLHRRVGQSVIMSCDALLLMWATNISSIISSHVIHPIGCDRHATVPIGVPHAHNYPT